MFDSTVLRSGYCPKSQKQFKNCSGSNHMASECTKGACRLCETVGHHTSVCRDLTPQDKGKGPLHALSTEGKTRTTTSRPAKQHIVTSPSPFEEEETRRRPESARTQTRESVHVLLDTGADRSFISMNQQLASSSTTQRESSYKSVLSDPMNSWKTCGITKVYLWDSSGERYLFSVTPIKHLRILFTRASFPKKIYSSSLKTASNCQPNHANR
ncbi:hypothetical protein COOONC_28547 [Cooperia oncophora]